MCVPKSESAESITKRFFDYSRFAIIKSIDDLSENQFLWNMWAKHLPIMIAKWSYALLRKGRWFSDLECMWVMLIKVLLSNHLLIKLRFIETKRTITWVVDLQLPCLKANWLNLVVAFTYIARNWIALGKWNSSVQEISLSHKIWFPLKENEISSTVSIKYI